jgi:hypothetical protein
VLFVVGVVIGMVASIYQISQPQSLDDIDGLDRATAHLGRDVSAVLAESVERQIPATLTETEINRWLTRTLTVKQGGRFAQQVEIKRLAVRLTEGVAEVIIERDIAGQPFTSSIFISIHQSSEGSGLRTDVNFHGGRYAPWLPFPPRGGRYGSLVVPQGFLRIVMPSYEAIGDQLKPEILHGFEEMTTIKISDKKVEFDPRPVTMHKGG